MKKVERIWSDQDRGYVLAKFEDGTLLSQTEKSATLIVDGAATESWWKEEPSGDYWDAWLHQCDLENFNMISDMVGLVEEIGHTTGEKRERAAFALMLLTAW